MATTHEINPFNHDVPAEEQPMVNVYLNDRWVEVPKGMNVVEVVEKFGGFLPHYCYHKKLSISGNCRMCLFQMAMPKMDKERKPIMGEDGKPELNWLPRPMIGCATQVNEGMGIRVDSPLAVECRKGVMEFLLINHPLDCPICDQAGECKLQEYSSDYGTGTSRFVENKVKKPKNVDLGERIVLDDERCILCSRCVRFAREVVKDDVLGFVNRGSYNTLTAHPGKRFDNNYSLNTVDICPVGALTSKDFRFKMRVWFLQETKTICTGCGTGCNITVGARQGSVYRATPRENEEVNSLWMCDQGRFEYQYGDDENRVRYPSANVKGELFPTDWADILDQVSTKLKNFKGDEIAIVGSAKMTNEELYLLKTLADELKVAHLDAVPRSWEGDTFLRTTDKNPNTNGAELLEVSKGGKELKSIADGITAGKIKALLVFHEDVTEAGLSEEQLEKLELLVTTTTGQSKTTAKSHYVLAGCGFAEKRGSMINVHGRLQRLNKAVEPQYGSRDDWEIIRDLRLKATGGNGISMIEDVFKGMASNHKAFEGLSLSKIGDLGVQLEGVK